MKFTDIGIKNLKPTDKKFYIRESHGFALRVLPSGVKTFLFIYTVSGKRKEMNLGIYPDVSLGDAREKHGAAKKSLRLGIDPAALERQEKQKKIDDPTVASLIDEYIKKHAKPNKRSWAEDKRILEKDALKAWGDLKAADIKKRDVVLLLEKIVERGSPGSANNNFKVIRKMFRFAVERDILEHSPCDGVVMPAMVNRRERYLSEEEIKTFWCNLDSCRTSDEIKRVLKLVLLTAQRPGEVVGIHTSEIDGRWWTVPAERSKNKRGHRVYLTDTAIELLGGLKVLDKETGKMKDKGYLFPCPHSSKIKSISVNSVAHVLYRNQTVPVMVDGEQAVDDEGNPLTENKLGVANFTPHDLRRTAATFMSQIGFMDEVIDSVLNHAKQGIIRTYNLNRYDKEKQQALEAWDRKLKAIITGKQAGKVVPIKKKTA